MKHQSRTTQLNQTDQHLRGQLYLETILLSKLVDGLSSLPGGVSGIKHLEHQKTHRHSQPNSSYRLKTSTESIRPILRPHNSYMEAIIQL